MSNGSQKRAGAKGRRSKAPFAGIPKRILDSAEYANLSAVAVKLLLDVTGQYNGRNNGDLTTGWRFMSERGWKSKDTLYRALAELEESGFIIRTRQGRLPRLCSLFAVSFQAIDECGGKLDVRPTSSPPNTWNKNASLGTATGPYKYGYRANGTERRS